MVLKEIKKLEKYNEEMNQTRKKILRALFLQLRVRTLKKMIE